MREKCKLSEEIIAYLYEESNFALDFKEHIKSCNDCNEELRAFEILRKDLSVLREQAYNEFQPTNLEINKTEFVLTKLLNSYSWLFAWRPLALASLTICICLALILLITDRISRQNTAVSELGKHQKLLTDEKSLNENTARIDEPEISTEKLKVNLKEEQKGETFIGTKPLTKTQKNTTKKAIRSKQPKKQFDFMNEPDIDEGLRLADLFEEIGEI
jgi:ssDNA-binding Zn-finger/Zn-ribbon topoisomerase 1